MLLGRWLTRFILIYGAELVISYALRGATWLIMKIDELFNAHAFKLGSPLTFTMAVMIGIVSLGRPFLDPKFMQRWFLSP